MDITKDLKTLGKLKREVEKAKRTLSSQMSTRLEIESFFKGEDFSVRIPEPSEHPGWISRLCSDLKF